MDPTLTSAPLGGQGKASADISERGPERESVKNSRAPSGPRRFLARAIQFFSSAILFQSFFFLVFATVPLVWVHLTRGRLQALGSSLCCALLIFLLSGWAGTAGYLVFSVATAWMVAELSRLLASSRKSSDALAPRRLVQLLLGSAFGVLGFFFVVMLIWAKTSHVSPWQELSKMLDWLGAEMMRQSPSGALDQADWSGLKEDWLRYFPSSLGVAVLVQCWITLAVTFRLNPNRIRERLGLPSSFYRIWKTPDFFVWLTILFGFTALFSSGFLEGFSGNGLRIVLSLYGLQGLAVLSAVFDLWRLRGFVRTLSFFLALGLMLPLVLALGFFDLWFDFRSKLRQS